MYTLLATIFSALTFAGIRVFLPEISELIAFVVSIPVGALIAIITLFILATQHEKKHVRQFNPETGEFEIRKKENEQ